MSRIGRKPIKIPKGVKVAIDGHKITAQGPLGRLELDLRPEIEVEIEDEVIYVRRKSDAKPVRALHGLYRALINNMVIGVSQGFKKELVLQGVGYRVQKTKQGIQLQVGFSHPVDFAIPEGIECEVPSPTEIVIKGADRQLVGEVAAQIRKIRPPNPYTLKGISYKGEYIKKKVGKRGITEA
ncbi:50S ribosomal protein L6 [candidate division WOR-3 bacterium]|uniref:Large ribosomal subunit protein uL6 n=1 Tax=candidate division WOR-3 bacterium TaxID=2052148 RepID=A0A660SEQ8_UNCW3|nr:MAG: 50S ribosomal protein L6 [candidate division WOR-3 bacterium]